MAFPSPGFAAAAFAGSPLAGGAPPGPAGASEGSPAQFLYGGGGHQQHSGKGGRGAHRPHWPHGQTVPGC